MNNVDYVVICANQGVNKGNLLVHPDTGLNLPVYDHHSKCQAESQINWYHVDHETVYQWVTILYILTVMHELISAGIAILW